MSGNERLTVLLTGGAGVLGDALVRQLQADYDVICLTRKTPIRVAGVEQLQADITLERLGLDARDYQRLCERTQWVIHSAAITRLTGKSKEIFTVNSTGTERLLELAAEARSPFYHISTAFTHPCDYFDGVSGGTPYEMAKLQAETVVRTASVASSIFRPSILIGNACDGYMPQFQGLHSTMALVMGGFLPMLPCPPGGYVDVIARDVAASAIKASLDQRRIGEEHFLTSGQRSLTMDTLLALIGATLRQHNRPFLRPRCIDPDVYERLIRPVFLPSLQGPVKAVLSRAIHMCRYVSLRSPLPSTLESLLGAQACAERSAVSEMLATLDQIVPLLDDFNRQFSVGRRVQAAS